MTPTTSTPSSTVDTVIRGRRTHKTYGRRPVDRVTLDELFELARWAPNHHLTNPWRFRVIGPGALVRLKHACDAAKPGSSRKLDRAPTMIAVTARQTGDAAQDREDVLATGVASYIVLLAAHARGLAGYWRTLDVMNEPAGRAALGIPATETAIALLHLGTPEHTPPPTERAPLDEIVTYLD